MNKFTRFLPFIFIEWYSKKYLQRNSDSQNGTFVMPFKNTRIYIPKETK